MAVPDQRLMDDGGHEVYREDLYAFEGLATTVPSLADIGPEAYGFFAQNGYLAVERAFTPQEVEGALNGLMSLLAGDNPDFRGVMYEKASAGLDVSALNLNAKQDYVRKFMHFVDYDATLRDLSRHASLLRVLEPMVGGKPALFQDMALLKPPRIGREKPWHQDHAYFNLKLDAPVVGVWIALDEATVDNGCMIVLPGSHLQGPMIHFRRRDWQICDKDANQGAAVAVPLKPGGALFFASLLHHGTPVNHSPRRRRALQFHYCAEEVRKISQDERMAVFGSEGKDATC